MLEEPVEDVVYVPMQVDVLVVVSAEADPAEPVMVRVKDCIALPVVEAAGAVPEE